MDNTSNNVTDAQRADGSASDQRSTSESQRDESTPTIEELKARIAELSRENSKHRNRAKEQEAAAQQAEEQRLKEQGEFKQLAEKHAARVQELEPVAERYTKLADQVRSQIQAETKDWPAEVKAFYPGDDAPVEQINEWYARSKPLMEKLQQQARSTNPGNAPSPRPASGEPSRQEQIDRFKQERVRSGMYGL